MAKQPSQPTLRNQKSVAVGTSEVELIGPNSNRTALLLSTPLAARVTLSFVGPAVLDSGINLYPGNNPICLAQDVIGDAITEEIRAIAAAGTEAITVVEFFR